MSVEESDGIHTNQTPHRPPCPTATGNQRVRLVKSGRSNGMMLVRHKDYVLSFSLPSVVRPLQTVVHGCKRSCKTTDGRKRQRRYHEYRTRRQQFQPRCLSQPASTCGQSILTTKFSPIVTTVCKSLVILSAGTIFLRSERLIRSGKRGENRSHGKDDKIFVNDGSCRSI